MKVLKYIFVYITIQTEHFMSTEKVEISTFTEGPLFSLAILFFVVCCCF